MNRKVFLLNEGRLGVFNETETRIEMMGAKDEAALQKCLQEFPELIPASEIDVENPPRFIIIKAEAGITAGSIDILMLDSKGMLNVVETKLYQNREIRRAVIGQALEYAAHLVMEWDANKVRDEGSRYWRGKDIDFDEKIADDLLDADEDAESFWAKVQENLDQMKVRIIVATDKVPKELRQIVEFFNRNSDIEILALEVKLFGDADGKKVLVPYLLGVKEKRETQKGTRGEWWSASKLERVINGEPFAQRKERYLDLMHFCQSLGAFDEPFSQNPSFLVRNKEGKHLMTFYCKGNIYVALHEDRFEQPSGLKEFVKKLNALSIFDYKETDFEHFRKAPGKLEELDAEEYGRLKDIIALSYDKK